MAMGYVNTWMGDRFSALLMSLMALQLTLVDQNPFQPSGACIRQVLTAECREFYGEVAIIKIVFTKKNISTQSINRIILS